MKLSTAIVVVLYLTGQTMASEQRRHGVAINSFTESLRKFTGAMYAKVAKTVKPTENIFFSPTSIAHTLGMILVGSKGNTEAEIVRALRIDTDLNLSAYNYKKLYKKVHNKIFNTAKNNTHSKALLASRVYVDDGYQVNANYTKDLVQYFDSEFVPTNFSQAETVVTVINQWVASRTGGLIPDLMSPDQIEPLTRLVLVNALYFKAAWHTNMSKLDEPMVFHELNNNDRNVNYMEMRNGFKYKKYEDRNEFIIPYRDSEADLVIIMPSSDENFFSFGEFGSLEQYFINAKHNIENMRSTRSILRMPIFEIEQKMDVKTILEAMGVKDLFDSAEADLSGIALESLHVSSFVHKAKVKVDEQGTIAAAASAAAMTGRSIGPERITINRPFYFGIYRLGHFLFFGRVVSPQSESQPVEH